MYFTREPVIETVITSREGYKLSVRNTKHLSQDPFIVEAVEVVCLGNTSFFRNCDHSKPFIVPAGDYEIMEVRDTKINLKAVGLERGVKIAGGREALLKAATSIMDKEPDLDEEIDAAPVHVVAPASGKKEKKKDFSKNEKWKEKKKQLRRKKDLNDVVNSSLEAMDAAQDEGCEECEATSSVEEKKFVLLPPPDKLISEVLSQVEQDSEDIFVSADLDESIQSLMNESADVIESLLSNEEETVPVSFEEDHERQ